MGARHQSFRRIPNGHHRPRPGFWHPHCHRAPQSGATAAVFSAAFNAPFNGSFHLSGAAAAPLLSDPTGTTSVSHPLVKVL
jgi:hypothetical protein